MVRFKNRYLVLEARTVDSGKQSQLKMKAHALYSALLEQLERLHGDFGVAAARNGLVTKYCSEYTQVAYIRARHGPHKLVACAVPLVTKLEGLDVRLRTIYTGGSVRQCDRFLRDYHLQQLSSVQDEPLKGKVLEAFINPRPSGQPKSNINP